MSDDLFLSLNMNPLFPTIYYSPIFLNSPWVRGIYVFFAYFLRVFRFLPTLTTMHLFIIQWTLLSSKLIENARNLVILFCSTWSVPTVNRFFCVVWKLSLRTIKVIWTCRAYWSSVCNICKIPHSRPSVVCVRNGKRSNSRAPTALQILSSFISTNLVA